MIEKLQVLWKHKARKQSPQGFRGGTYNVEKNSITKRTCQRDYGYEM